MATESENDEIVMALVEEALAQPAEHREAYLRSACSQNPHLFEQVWSYVRWEERMDGFLLDPWYAPPANNGRSIRSSGGDTSGRNSLQFGHGNSQSHQEDRSGRRLTEKHLKVTDVTRDAIQKLQP